MAMLIGSGLPKAFWSDAMQTAATVIGRTPAARLRGDVSYTKLFKQKVNISWLKPFGLTCYVLIPKDQCSRKFSNKSRKSIFIGYTEGKKAYQLLNVKTRKGFHSHHVHFDEDGDSLPVFLGNEDNTTKKWEPDFLHPNPKEKPAVLNDNSIFHNSDDKLPDKHPRIPTESSPSPTPKVAPKNPSKSLTNIPPTANSEPITREKRKHTPQTPPSNAGSVGALLRERSMCMQKSTTENVDYQRAVDLEEHQREEEQYIKSVVERCGMEGSKPTWTPMASNSRLTVDDPENNTMIFETKIEGKQVSYSSVVGSLMYAMMGTQPDIAYAVGVLSHFNSNPKRHHCIAAKRVLRYLNTTSKMELKFDGNDVGMDMSFHGYSDADWSGDPDTSRSTSGYVFISTRGAIGWASKRQTMVSLSSMESEYIGLCYAGQHLAWLRNFFEDIGYTQRTPSELLCDNQAAIILTKEAQYRSRTKHIQRKYHYFRDDLVSKGQAVVRYVPTEDMVADIFTKALGHEKHWKFTKAMGLRLHTSGSVKG
ncbi:hypothetical protein E4T56_gene14132 [Termitomyces sp. T112]|nr:hypothetical protein E4T56_gene14132 [Termitomyces sp. T112]